MPTVVARHLPGPEPLVGDRAVAEHLAGAHVVVGGEEVTGDGEQQTDRQLGHAVGVAAGRVEHRDAGRGGPGDVDVGGVAAGGADGHERQVEHGALHLVGLAHDDGGALGPGPFGQVGGAVEAQRLVVDPRIEDDVGDLGQPVGARPPEGCGDERGGAGGGRLGGHDAPSCGSRPSAQS